MIWLTSSRLVDVGQSDIRCLDCLWLCVGVWRPATCWSQRTDRSACRVCGASSVWSVMAREPKLFTTSLSTASRCCPGSAPRCCSRYSSSFLHKQAYYKIPSLPKSASSRVQIQQLLLLNCTVTLSVQLQGNRGDMGVKLTINFICMFFWSFLPEPAGLRLSVGHLQPRHHSLWTGQWTCALQRHASYTGDKNRVYFGKIKLVGV